MKIGCTLWSLWLKSVRKVLTCPWEQLEGSVGAVFSSWMNDRAIVYRRK